jgi:hypothetical protein
LARRLGTPGRSCLGAGHLLSPLRTPLSGADIDGVKQHCAQCLTEVFTSGYATPTGETLCSPCYVALWGPNSTELRLMVERHLGPSNGNGSAAPARG